MCSLRQSVNALPEMPAAGEHRELAQAIIARRMTEIMRDLTT